MSRPFRFALATCWLIVAFLLARMAWGGSLFGIVYVVEVNNPAVLIAGTATIVGALAVAILLAVGATVRAGWISIALAFLAIPLSIVLVPEHRSAPVVGAAALIAMAISIRSVLDTPSGASPPQP